MPIMPLTRGWAGQRRVGLRTWLSFKRMADHPSVRAGRGQAGRLWGPPGVGYNPGVSAIRVSVSGKRDMSQRKSIRAVFPGAFDPPSHGHLDIIKRARQFVDELIVAVGRNPEKRELFDAQERVEMLREMIGDTPRVRVEAYEGLTAEFVRRVDAQMIIRGIRDNVDLHYELQQSNINLIVGEVETIFLMTRDQFAMTSSTYIKQIVELGCNDMERLSRLVPLSVAERLRKKFGRPKT
jgi:pantetheine-phosphate adenylyltransferase